MQIGETTNRRYLDALAEVTPTGILAKIPGRRRYRVTLPGRRLLAAAVHYRKAEFPDALAA